MNILGSSVVTQLGASYSVTGPTGPTGPAGATGPAGYGLTGFSGPNIVGITLVNRYIITTFSNGQTASTPSQIYCATGNAEYNLAFYNLGTGVSFAYGITGTNLQLRPIKFVNNSNSILSVTDTGNYVEINLQNVSGGVTVENSISAERRLLKFNSSGAVVRVSNTLGNTYDSDTTNPKVKSVNFINANVFEYVRGAGFTGATAAINCEHSTAGVTCTFNPFAAEYNELMFGSRAKVFVADFYGNTGSIIVNDYPSDGNVYGFDLIISNAKNPKNLSTRFSSNIKWVQNEPPCLSVDGVTCDMKVAMFGIDGTWYATAIPLTHRCADTLYASLCSTTGNLLLQSYGDEILGACCKKDGTCVETAAFLCDGFFHGIGTVCGSATDSICDKPGACCRETTSSGVPVRAPIPGELTCKECLSRLGTEVVKYAGNASKISTVNCDKVFTRTGCCCDGRGNGTVASYEDCVAGGYFYQGDGTDCFDAFDRPLCSAGTGPCCINGNCTQQKYTDCFDSNGFYGGLGQPCDLFECPKEVSCLGFVDGVPIVAGSRYGGGIVVGKYSPNKSQIFGANDLFTPTGLTAAHRGLTFDAKYYRSFVDHTAYGITKDCNFINEDYIIIVYPHDLAIDGSRNIKNPINEQFTRAVFPWGGTGSAWGPILSSSYTYNDLSQNYQQTHLYFSEGYWSTGFTGITQAEDPQVSSNTFPTCTASIAISGSGVDRVLSKSPYGMHGLWHQSWGLYNTIRAISAKNTRDKKINSSPVNYFNYKDFAGATLVDAFRCVRLVPDGITSDTQGNVANNAALSGWYLPSHDEMAFIALNTVDPFGFNVNSVLITTTNGQPINGTYWTSTGTFDYNKQEGIYTQGSKVNPGSVAIAMNIDVGGNTNNYKIYKSDRQQQHKIRPIRAIRCDSLIPSSKKIWSIPSVFVDRDKSINQEISINQPGTA